MEISVISSLTSEDESRFAGALMNAIAGMLDLLPIAYVIRIETVSGKTLDRSRSAHDVGDPPRSADGVVSKLSAVARDTAPAGQELHGRHPGL